MLDKDRLRRADIFTGGIVFFFGIFIVSQALQMPMKDTYGGVQNVWYVSPAIFPLFIGAIISILGISLIFIAFKSVGKSGIDKVFKYITSSDLIFFLKSVETIRFYAIIFAFSSFIFLMIPRIDFFLCAILFLMVFISMFYFDDDGLLKKIFIFYIGINLCLFLFFSFKLDAVAGKSIVYPADWLTILCIAAFIIYSGLLVKNRSDLKKKYRLCLVLAVITPTLIGVIFKYLLLVPMPFEGVVVELMDAIRYYGD